MGAITSRAKWPPVQKKRVVVGSEIVHYFDEEGFYVGSEEVSCEKEVSDTSGMAGDGSFCERSAMPSCRKKISSVDDEKPSRYMERGFHRTDELGH